MLRAKGQTIGKYRILFPIKEGSYAETYRVKDDCGKTLFLKLINLSKLDKNQFGRDGTILEVEISKVLHHTNLLAFHDQEQVIFDSSRFVAVSYDFICGETLTQRLNREETFSVHQAKEVVKGVLSGLVCMHGQKKPILHNELTLQNVMLDLSGDFPISKIIDFGHARFFEQNLNFYPSDLDNLFFRASETFNSVFTPQTDVYSVGAILYTLIFGLPPYFEGLSDISGEQNELQERLVEERRCGLHIPSGEIFELDSHTIDVIVRALAENVDDRYSSAEQMLEDLKRTVCTQTGSVQVKQKETDKQNAQMEKNHKKVIEASVKLGNGFSDVAGMSELKEQLQSDVIDVLRDSERAVDLGISIPNGLLFYGPPGCGKTYFAEKFAEEIGCNYMYVKCSDIASPYIHGGQNKIAAVFDEARKKAPTIIFFDEIEAMITDRRRHNTVSESGEVNEFLTQLNNCGQHKVIVIGATNKPDILDPAALRSGRFDYKYYIPQPDKKTREKLFEITLSKRKVDFGIDYEKLAERTRDFVSADIRLVVDKAARLVFRRKLKKITMDILLEVLKDFKPSVSAETIKEHECIRDRFNGIAETTKHKPIGFC